MQSCSPPNLLSRSLIGAVGLGVALLGLPQSAKAFTVNRGTDYLVTPSEGTVYNFVDPLPGAGTVTVNFKGLAIGTGIPEADTVVNRLQDVDATAAGGTTPIEVVDLSLQSVAPVTINGTNYDVFVGLQKYLNGTTSTGSMTIRDTGGANGKTWDSSFTINAVAIVAVAGTLTPTGTDYIKGLIQGCPTATSFQCLPFGKGPFLANNEPWTNFGSYFNPTPFGEVGHTYDKNTHTVIAVPEPLTILGSLTAFGFGAAFKRKRDNKNQKA